MIDDHRHLDISKGSRGMANFFGFWSTNSDRCDPSHEVSINLDKQSLFLRIPSLSPGGGSCE